MEGGNNNNNNKINNNVQERKVMMIADPTRDIVGIEGGNNNNNNKNNNNSIQERKVMMVADPTRDVSIEGGNNKNNNGQERKVMVVVDPSRESASALQYALSHAVLENDKLILLHVEKYPNSWRKKIPLFKKSKSGLNLVSVAAANSSSEGGGGESSDFLEEMKQACEAMQPKVQVCVEKVEMEGKEKAATILSRSASHETDLLIIGQRRKLSNTILGQRRNGSFRGLDTAETLIENSNCTCVAVQRKGQDSGYILNTKTHKNFWLLA